MTIKKVYTLEELKVLLRDLVKEEIIKRGGNPVEDYEEGDFQDILSDYLEDEGEVFYIAADTAVGRKAMSSRVVDELL
ncbi:MAG: hypothetical protein ACI9QC_000252 [Oceanicoccus sp.]|jgi:hypothetical protein